MASGAKERFNARNRKYNKNDVLQPFNERGKPNRKFIKVYGKEVYDENKTKLN